MQVCISLHTDNHASSPPLSFFYRPDALPVAQPTASKHWEWKSRRWWAIMEEVDKGCNECCVTVTTTACRPCILIHSRLIRSNNPCWLKAPYRGWAPTQWTSLSVRIRLLLPHGYGWVKVSTGTSSPGRVCMYTECKLATSYKYS